MLCVEISVFYSLRYSSRTCLGVLTKTTKGLSQDRKSLDPALNLGPAKHDTGVLTFQLDRDVRF